MGSRERRSFVRLHKRSEVICCVGLREPGIIISRFWLVGRGGQAPPPSFLSTAAFPGQREWEKFLRIFDRCVSERQNPLIHYFVFFWDVDLSTFGGMKEERCSLNIPKAGGQTICAPIEYGRNTKRALMSRSPREWRLILRRRRRRNGKTKILFDIQSDNSYLTPIVIIIATPEVQGAQSQIRHALRLA